MTGNTARIAISLARIGWSVFPWDDALSKGHVSWTATPGEGGATTDEGTISEWC